MPDLQNLLSGYGEFDSRTGGFRRGSIVLCLGSHDSDAEFFAAGALAHALSGGGGGSIVLTTQTPAEFRKAAGKRGLYFAKFEAEGTFCFIDAYSRLVGGKEESVRSVNGPLDLKGVVANVADFNSALFRKGVPSVFVLDSLIGLAMHNSQGMLVHFIGELAGILKRTESVLFLVFHEVFEDSSFLEKIAPFVDATVEFMYKDGVASARLGGAEWIALPGLGSGRERPQGGVA